MMFRRGPRLDIAELAATRDALDRQTAALNQLVEVMTPYLAKGDLVDEFLASMRARLRAQFDQAVVRDAEIVARIDQVQSLLRDRLAECGIRPTDDIVRATLLVVADTFVASEVGIPLDSDSARALWAVTAQFALAVLQLDYHGANA